MRLGAVVPDGQQAESVDEDRAGEAGIDRADLLRRDDQVNIGEAAAAVFARQHAKRDAGLVGGDVGVLGLLEGPQRIGLLVGAADARREHVFRELPCARLQLALLVGQREVDGHSPLSLLVLGPLTGEDASRRLRRAIARGGSGGCRSES